MTEHQIHIFVGVAVLAIVIFGLLRLLAFVDLRGERTRGLSNRLEKSRFRRARPKRRKPASSKKQNRQAGDPG